MSNEIEINLEEQAAEQEQAEAKQGESVASAEGQDTSSLAQTQTSDTAHAEGNDSTSDAGDAEASTPLEVSAPAEGEPATAQVNSEESALTALNEASETLQESSGAEEKEGGDTLGELVSGAAEQAEATTEEVVPN